MVKVVEIMMFANELSRIDKIRSSCLLYVKINATKLASCWRSTSLAIIVHELIRRAAELIERVNRVALVDELKAEDIRLTFSKCRNFT